MCLMGKKKVAWIFLSYLFLWHPIILYPIPFVHELFAGTSCAYKYATVSLVDYSRITGLFFQHPVFISHVLPCTQGSAVFMWGLLGRALKAAHSIRNANGFQISTSQTTLHCSKHSYKQIYASMLTVKFPEVGLPVWGKDILKSLEIFVKLPSRKKERRSSNLHPQRPSMCFS